jgi:NTP pyrophosphatase (non-canonical NTP hydrolase)
MNKIYQATIARWGVDAQYDQAIEECAELIAALKHFKRGKVTRQEVIEELADATLMLGQLRWMFGEELVESAISDKLEKLKQLLDEDKKG